MHGEHIQEPLQFVAAYSNPTVVEDPPQFAKPQLVDLNRRARLFRHGAPKESLGLLAERP
jgi:hypothetical protein